MTFSAKVKFAREKMQLSQERLAAQLGVSFSTVNRWERGHAMPSYMAQEKFFQLCKKNGVEFKETDNG